MFSDFHGSQPPLSSFFQTTGFYGHGAADNMCSPMLRPDQWGQSNRSGIAGFTFPHIDWSASLASFMGHIRVQTLLSFALVKCGVMVWIWRFGMRRGYKNAGYVTVECTVGSSPGKGNTALLRRHWGVVVCPPPCSPLHHRRERSWREGRKMVRLS